MSEPKTERGRETRERILATAARLFHERGVNATSVEHILAASATGKSQFYRYFPSKDQLVKDVIRSHFDRYVGWQRSSLERLDGLDGLEEYFRSLIDLYSERKLVGGCPIGSLAAELADQDESLRDELARAFELWRGSLERGPLGFMLSMAVPAAIAILGVAVLGFDEIDWPGAVVWGVVATAAFTVFSMLGGAMGMTRMDLLDLLGSGAARPGTGTSRAVGALTHHMNGALLAIAWAYGVALVDLPANWATGLVWGAILTVLALWMLSAVGSVHPAIKRGEQEDPGLAATNFGAMTPMGSLMGHLVYGLVFGLTYNAWPLS